MFSCSSRVVCWEQNVCLGRTKQFCIMLSRENTEGANHTLLPGIHLLIGSVFRFGPSNITLFTKINTR